MNSDNGSSTDWPGKAKTIDDLKTAWTEEEKSLQTVNPEYQNTEVSRIQRLRQQVFSMLKRQMESGGSLTLKVTCSSQTAAAASIPSLTWHGSGDVNIFLRHCLRMPISQAHRHSEKRDGIYSFYSWNLFRRLGSDWYQKWINLTVLRMNSWGINTIGNWSDPNLGESHQKAYVATLEGWGIETGKMGMPDVYAPGYAAMVDSAAASQCASKKDDPYLLGYFIGNEPPWPGRETELAAGYSGRKRDPNADRIEKISFGWRYS